MNLRYLHTFEIVAASPSLTGAAQRLGLTQSAVSLQLQKLEAEFGAQLVERSHQPLRLTAAGEELLARARSLLGGFESAVDAVQRVATDVAGTLRLTASSTPGEHLVPAILADFLEQYPRARADLVVTDTEGAYALVVAGRASFGFVGARRDDLGLTHEVLARDEVILVGPPSPRSPRGDAGSVAIEDLVSLPLVVREEGSGTLAALGQGLRTAGAQAVGSGVRLVAGSATAQLNAVRAGAGYAFVSRRAAADRLKAGSVREVAVIGLHLVRDIYVAYDAGRIAGALRCTFLEYLRLRMEGDGLAGPS